jgi:hypothetical protein
MKLLLLAFAFASSASPAGAAETVAPSAPLQLRPKVLVGATLAPGSAPFVNPAAERELDLMPREERHELRPSSCEGQSTLCYDPKAGHIVFKPARQLMPDIPGLQRENISIKRDRIIFRYSF